MPENGNSSDGIENGLRRANPINVPETWYTEALELERLSIERQGPYERPSINDMLKARIDKKPLIFLLDDIEAFFETSIANKEIAEAWEVYSPYFFSDLYAAVPDSEMFNVHRIIWFLKWWLMTRFEIEPDDFPTFLRVYSSGSYRAIASFFKTGDIEASYELMREKCDSLGFVTGEKYNG